MRIAVETLPKANQEDPNLMSLIDLIGWLDGYRALSCVDPVRIERVVRKYPKHDLRAIWREVKSDVFRIASLPASSPEIVRMYKILTISKLLFLMLAMATTMVSVAAARLNASFFFASVFGLFILVLLAVLYNANIIIYYVYNKRLYKKVRTTYEEHSQEWEERRKRIKHATQQIIYKVAQYINRQGYNPEKYQFSLFHADYNNIKIIKQKRKKYSAIIKT
jgi:hypothetical protein